MWLLVLLVLPMCIGADLQQFFDTRNSALADPTWQAHSAGTTRWLLARTFWSDAAGEQTTPMEYQNDVLSEVAEFYRENSWGVCQIEYVLPPESWNLPLSKSDPSFNDLEDAARTAVEGSGYIAGDDFDGIIITYYTADNGPFSGGGGWGGVNSFTEWNSYPLGYSVLRHELGHNFGHSHHHSNKYYWRDSRGPDQSTYDGFDCMSGGNDNGDGRADFNVASKRWYGWISDDNLVYLRPEGFSNACPQCRSGGTFVLTAFDDDVFSTPTDSPAPIYGLVIPLYVDGNSLNEYYVSFRTGYVHSRKGVGIHHNWINNPGGGPFGASFDSLNYDAFGGTETRDDAFVLPGTTYVVTPTVKGMDDNIDAVANILVAVTVQSVSDHTAEVTVEFLKPSQAEPAPTTLTCTTAGATISDVVPGEMRVIKVSSGGTDGTVSVMVSPDAASGASATVYVHDAYPFAPVLYASPPGYGAMKSLTVSSTQACSAQGVADLPVLGALAIKVSQTANEFLHLAEIEAFDSAGTNVMLEATCSSFSGGYDGDPSCLNDGVLGNYPDVCTSHSAGPTTDNYDVCFLSAPAEIVSIVVHPFVDPERLWMTGRMSDLLVEVFASGSSGDDVSGVIYSDHVFFSSSEFLPSQLNVTSATTVPCPGDPLPDPLEYKIEGGEAWLVVVGSEPAASVTLDITGTVTTCHRNEYLSGGACVRCPEGQTAPEGSTDVSACQECEWGRVYSPIGYCQRTPPPPYSLRVHHGNGPASCVDGEYAPQLGEIGGRPWFANAALDRVLYFDATTSKWLLDSDTDTDRSYASFDDDSTPWEKTDVLWTEASGAPVQEYPLVKAIRITQPVEDFLHISEVELLDMSGTNVALGAAAFSSSVAYGGITAALTDGSTCEGLLDGMDDGNACNFSHTGASGGWNLIVLDTPARIATVNLYPWHRFRGRLKNISVELFSDSVAAVEPETVPSVSGVVHATRARLSLEKIRLDVPALGTEDMLRVDVIGAEDICVDELELFCTQSYGSADRAASAVVPVTLTGSLGCSGKGTSDEPVLAFLLSSCRARSADTPGGSTTTTGVEPGSCDISTGVVTTAATGSTGVSSGTGSSTGTTSSTATGSSSSASSTASGATGSTEGEASAASGLLPLFALICASVTCAF